MIKEKSIKIKGKEITYKLRKKRGLRRITLSVHSDASVSISTPFFVSQKRAEGFLLEKSEWLISKISFYNEIRKRRNIFTGFGDYKDKKEDVRKIVEKKLEYYNSIYNFKYNKICIRNQRSRWGSCSSDKNLNFNYRLIYLDDELFDYVVVHELCHLKQMNHSEKFWKLVSKVKPNHKELRVKLKEKGVELF